MQQRATLKCAHISNVCTPARANTRAKPNIKLNVRPITCTTPTTNHTRPPTNTLRTGCEAVVSDSVRAGAEVEASCNCVHVQCAMQRGTNSCMALGWWSLGACYLVVQCVYREGCNTA